MRDKLTGILFILLGGLLVVICLVLVFDVMGQQLTEESERTAIQQVLETQAQAWNRGDLDAFMTGYHQANDLTFFSGGKTHQGWQATRERYRDRYQGEGKAMGTLRFSALRIELSGPQAAFVRGQYHLTTGDKLDEGLFTLVCRKTPAGWRIVHDHTSQ